MTIWFTSDHHFGHENIIRFCNRPFQSIEEMDRVLIERWNEVVEPCDTVYHLGDFTLGDRDAARSYFNQLNGQIYVLANLWHHDKRWLSASGGIMAGVGLKPPMVVLEFPELGDGIHPQVVVLCHYPIAVWDRKHYGAWHLFGHSHGNHDNGGKSLDVGVDENNFYPFSLAQVAGLLSKKEV